MQINCAYFIWQFGRGFFCRFGKFMRHAIFAYGDFDFHTGIIDVTKDFDDLADGLAKT
ncbi:hypothetical protein D3C81_1438220 [compost metagenome]